IAIDLPLLLFHRADEVPERLLIPVAERHSPPLRTRVLRSAASRLCHHAKPGRALPRGDSTLARSGTYEYREQKRAARKCSVVAPPGHRRSKYSSRSGLKAITRLY